jgi:hypothetical protein
MVECERVSAAYFEVKAAFCCEFVIMLWWMALSSAVIGCCGCWSTWAIGCTANLKHRSEGDDVLAEFDEFDGILTKPPVLPARRAGAPSGSKKSRLIMARRLMMKHPPRLRDGRLGHDARS